MASLAETQAENSATLGALAAVPVAVFVGGTSGTGRGTAEAFARYTNGNAHIIIVGRSRKAAEEIIASFPAPTAPGAKHEFVECDVSLMKNVHAVTTGLAARLPAINYLVLSCASFDVGPDEKTAEGLDARLAIAFCARWKFTYELLPLLAKALPAPARVLSIYGAGLGGGVPVPLDDLGLLREYVFEDRRRLMCTYGDIWVTAFAARNPAIAFTHSSPGIVRTPLLATLLKMREMQIPPGTREHGEAGEYMLRALLLGEAGASWRGENAQALSRPKEEEISGEVQEAMWAYMVQTVGLKA